MGATQGPSTDPLLLGRLKDLTDARAWGEFVGRYAPRIYGWCRKQGLQAADAEDVTQTVLTNVARRMQSFAYDPGRSFRGWLKAVTRNAWADFVNSCEHGGRGAGDSEVVRLLGRLESGDELVEELDEKEFEREVLEEAMARVCLRVAPSTWQAFTLVAFEERPGDEVAGQLGMTVGAVYAARHRVQRLLQEEVRKLDSPDLP
jgi:RNA polymerase sigma-70 factor (ECF subfamily)